MPSCKNCGKEIPEGSQFCGVDCIRQYKAQDKDAEVLKKAYEQMEKEDSQRFEYQIQQTHKGVMQVLQALGRDDIDERGKIRDRHITKIITWLISHPSGRYGDLVAQLGLICGIRWRYILEYLEGFRAMGYLRITHESSGERYFWIGVPDAEG